MRDGCSTSTRANNVDIQATFAYDNEGMLMTERFPADDAGTTASLSAILAVIGRPLHWAT
jgi:hypothetical protein